MKKILLLSYLLVVTIVQGATAQTHPMPSSETVGLMTEPVARQRLAEHGYNLQSLYFEEDKYRAIATKDGKPVVVWMDAKTGRIEEKNPP
jgi:hypothetical protein